MIRMWLCLGMMGCVFGCFGGSGGGKELPKTVPVGGLVNLEGKPLAGATVTFYPTGQTKGVECVGTTDEAGKYKLKQIHGTDGAPPGEYKVVISLFLKPDGSKLGPNEQPINVGAAESIPQNYSDVDGTTLTATVPATGGDFPFEVTSR